MVTLSIPELASTKDCMGCSACMNICPHNAISMPWNKDGFHTPVVDLSICTGCGACTKVCPPLIHSDEIPTHENLQEMEIYSGWSLDETIRLKSSSGGLFSMLAQKIIEEGGCVVGVTQNPDLSLSHICVETIDGLEQLRGSKYFQSDLGLIFREVRQILKQGRFVLFSGTPCQIAGLLGYLRKPHPLLITCDLACHGTPSFNFFQQYAEYYGARNSSPLTSINFRLKVPDWLHYSVQRYYQNGTVDKTPHSEDFFMRGFLSDLCLNQPCYGCSWNVFPRLADFTLADYWACTTTHPDWNTQSGVSLVFIHTQQGKLWLDKIRDKLFLCEERLEDAVRYNQGLISAPSNSPIPKRRAQFLSDIVTLTIPQLVSKHTVANKPRKDIGIVGMWMTCNYGALLTTLGLYRLLESMELDPVLIDNAPMMKVQRFCDQNSEFRDFVHRCHMATTGPIETRAQLLELNECIDTFLVGSDQVWRYEYTSTNGYYYFLDFAHGDKRKIAFGSSFGSEIDTAPEEFRAMAACLLNRFDAVAVRETNAVDILVERYSIRPDLVLDPVFLCETSVYDDLAAQSTRNEDSPFIASYILDPTEDKRNALLQTQQHFGKKLVNMVDAQFDFEAKKALLNLENTIEGLSLEDWLYYTKSCDMLVTDSFHGVCFALIFKKPFICIANPERGYPRFTSLLGLTGLMDRMVFSSNELKQDSAVWETPDYKSIETLLDAWKEKSRNWLKKALTQPREKSITLSGLIVDQLLLERNQLEAFIQGYNQFIHQRNEYIESFNQFIHQSNEQHAKIRFDISQQLDFQHETSKILEQQKEEIKNLVRLTQYRNFLRKYRYYKVMSKITWGRKRKHYNSKRTYFKQELRDLRRMIAEHKFNS